jgi:hypothetical protein
MKTVNRLSLPRRSVGTSYTAMRGVLMCRTGSVLVCRINSANIKMFRHLFFASSLATGLAADNAAPSVTQFTYPSSVTAGSQFTASLIANDPSGVASITMNVYPQQGWWYPCQSQPSFTLVNGTIYDGTWSFICDLSQDTPDQTYHFNYYCCDTAHNCASKKITPEFIVTGGVTPDYNPPQIQKLSYPSDVKAGSDFTASLTLTDESGIENGYMVVRESIGSYIGCTANTIILDSGTATSGVWNATCYLDSTTPNGEYYLEIHVNDKQKNPTDLYEYHAMTVSGGDEPDHTKPTVTNIRVSDDDNHVEWGQTVEITAHISDAQSGIDHVDFNALAAYTSASLCKGSMAMTNGNNKDGTWSFSCYVPSGSECTVYTAQIYAYDNQNNLGYSTASFYVIVPPA